MTRVTRRYRFCASHRLNAAELSAEENRELYGKCNNPYGHGHNYTLDVTMAGETDARTGMVAPVGALDALVEERVLRELDHRSLNDEVAEFGEGGAVPTTENLAVWIEERLRAGWREAFGGRRPELSAVRLLETRKNSFELRT